MLDALTRKRWRQIGWGNYVETIGYRYPHLADYLGEHRDLIEPLREGSHVETDRILGTCETTMDAWNQRGNLRLAQEILAEKWARSSGLTAHQPHWLAL